MKPFVELATFQTKPEFTVDQVVTAAESVNVFLRGQQGFLSRHLGRADDGTWHDILFWKSQADVMTAMQTAASSAHCAAFFGMIDEGKDKMTLFPSHMAIFNMATFE